MRHFQQQGDMQMEQEGARPNPDFLPFAAIIENWQAWAGMAAFLSWVNVMLCFEGALRDEVIYEGGLVHDPVFYGVTATAALAFIVLRSRKNHPKKSRRKETVHCCRCAWDYWIGSRNRIGAHCPNRATRRFLSMRRMHRRRRRCNHHCMGQVARRARPERIARIGIDRNVHAMGALCDYDACSFRRTNGARLGAPKRVCRIAPSPRRHRRDPSVRGISRTTQDRQRHTEPHGNHGFHLLGNHPIHLDILHQDVHE